MAYGAINLDSQTRQNSTSGGVFTLLGQWVLQHGGVVFGAAYNEDFSVAHCRVESVDDLWKLRGAKYSQSVLGSAYLETAELLKEGRYVLFSGTPCQIAGLKAFLKSDDDKLILVDLICHGVPSPQIWRHYINYRKCMDADGENPTSINLRSKKSGWPGYSVCFEYTNQMHYDMLNIKDSYLWGYINNLFLRPSCYNCKFKGEHRESDFTLGDFWGVWDQYPQIHDGLGTSLTLIHTKKAEQIWTKVSDKMTCEEVDGFRALENNPAAVCSPEWTQKRELFFREYLKEDFQKVVDGLCPKPEALPKGSRWKRLVKKIYRKILCKISKSRRLE